MPPRKKTRLPNTQLGASANEPQTRSSMAAEATASPQTRSNGATMQAPARRTHIRGRLGGLKDMPNMPLDILVEIFSLMHPRDILNLARTTKNFRAFLMSRESEPFWRAARRQIEGLPQCLAFLSEPAYANLVFFTHCHSCLKPNVKTVLWEFLVRYCPNCKNDFVADSDSCWHLIDKVERTIGLKDVVSVHHSYPTRYSSYEEPQYHWPEIEQRQIEFTRAFPNQAGWDAWGARITEAVRARKVFADDMRQWALRQELNRDVELAKLRDARLEKVKQRLRDEGWAEELDYMCIGEKHELANLKGVRTSQKLTDHAWSTIRQHVVGYMGRVRERRLVRERHATLCVRFEAMAKMMAYLDTLIKPRRDAATDLRPAFADIAAAFHEAIDAIRVADVNVDQKTSDMTVAYQSIVESWLEARKAELSAMVRQAVPLVSDGVCALELAIATWDCTRCHWKGMRWEQVLAHECARHYWIPCAPDGDPGYHRALLVTCSRLDLPRVWTQKPFVFNPAVDKVRATIEACGEDPYRVTFKQMESCGARLFWRSSVSWSSCCVFDWKTAAEHGTEHDVTTVERLDEADAALARRLEELVARSDPTNSFYGCTQCRSGRMKLHDIKVHCTQQHAVEVVALGIHYYLHTDNKPRLPELVFIPLAPDPPAALEFDDWITIPVM